MDILSTITMSALQLKDSTRNCRVQMGTPRLAPTGANWNYFRGSPKVLRNAISSRGFRGVWPGVSSK
jgi:hypothetical protein